MGGWGTFKGDSSGSCGTDNDTCASVDDDGFAFDPIFTGGVRVPADDVVVDGLIITAENPGAPDAAPGGAVQVVLSDGSVRFSSSDFDLL